MPSKTYGVSFIPKKPNFRNYLSGLYLSSHASGLYANCEKIAIECSLLPLKISCPLESKSRNIWKPSNYKSCRTEDKVVLVVLGTRTGFVEIRTKKRLPFLALLGSFYCLHHIHVLGYLLENKFAITVNK